MASESHIYYPELPTATALAWLEIYNHFNDQMLTDQATEEQIQDNKEIQDGLLILSRLPLPSKRACNCGHCRDLNARSAWILENENSRMEGPNIVPQLGGKVSTKIQR